MNIKTTLTAPTQLRADAVLREDYGLARPAYSTAYEAAWVFSFATKSPYIVASAEQVTATVAQAESAPTFITHMVHGTQPIFSDAGCLGEARVGAYSLIPVFNEDTLTSDQVDSFIAFWQGCEAPGITGYDTTALWTTERARRSLTELDNSGAIAPQGATKFLPELFTEAADALIAMMGDNNAKIDANDEKVRKAQNAVDAFRERLLFVLTIRATQVVGNSWLGMAYHEREKSKDNIDDQFVPKIPRECRAILRSAYPTYYADGSVPTSVAPLLIGSVQLTNKKPVLSVNGTASGFASDGDLSMARAALTLRAGFDPFEHSMWVANPKDLKLKSGDKKTLFLQVDDKGANLMTVSELLSLGVGFLRRGNGITYYPTQPRFPRDTKLTPLFSMCREIVYPHLGSTAYPMNDPLTHYIFAKVVRKLPKNQEGMIPVAAWDFRIDYETMGGIGLDADSVKNIAKSLPNGYSGSDDQIIIGRFASSERYGRYTLVACQKVKLPDEAYVSIKEIFLGEEGGN